MTAPSPAGVRAGHVIKLRARGHTWTSPVLPPAVAEHQAAQLTKSIEDVGAAQAFVDFVCGDERLVSVRARDVFAVEAGPIAPPAPAPVGAGTAVSLATASPEQVADAVVRP